MAPEAQHFARGLSQQENPVSDFRALDTNGARRDPRNLP